MSNIISWPFGSPNLAFQSYTLALTRKSTLLRSPFTGKRQVINTPYALWTFKGKFSKNAGLNAGLLRSFLTKLQGQANKFRMPLPEAQFPLSGYNPAQTGYVITAGQTGNVLTTVGWIANTFIIAEGDYFTINDELKMATQNVTSDGSNNATLTFTPPLRYSPPQFSQVRLGVSPNLLGFSNGFGFNNYWNAANSTITAGVTDPFGGTNAFSLNTTATANAYIYQNVAFGPTAGLTFTFSVSLKQGVGGGTVNFFIRDGSGSINIAAVTVTPTATWTRYSITGTAPLNTAPDLEVIIDPNHDTAGDTLLMYCAQLEVGSSATPYVFTTTGAGVPTILLSSNIDDAASWDLTPPLLYDVAFDCIEAFE